MVSKAVDKCNARILKVKKKEGETNLEVKGPVVLVCGEADGALNLEKMLSDQTSPAVPEFEEVDEHRDTCAVFWSSGTTGQSKGICHTPYSVWNFGGFAMELQLRESIYFSSLSLFHCSGYWLGVVALLRRNTIYMVCGISFSRLHSICVRYFSLFLLVYFCKTDAFLSCYRYYQEVLRMTDGSSFPWRNDKHF